MPHAARLMLDSGQWLVRVDVNDIKKAVLMLIALFGDQATFKQLFVRTGKVSQRDLNMVPVVIRKIGVGLTVNHLAFAGARGPCVGPPFVLSNAGDAAKDLRIEFRDSGYIGPSRDI